MNRYKWDFDPTHFPAPARDARATLPPLPPPPPPPPVPIGRRRCYYCSQLAVDLRDVVPRCADHAKPFEQRKDR